MELRITREGSAWLAVLDRPQRRNALTLEILDAMRDLLRRAGREDDAAGVVLTGAGSAFCAGLDLDMLHEDPGLFDGWPLPDWFETCAVPVIAAINGPAMTGGMEVALNADLRIAAPEAVFADTHGRVGVLPGWGMSALLPGLVGPSAALDLSLTSRRVTADEALRLGLVERVVPGADLIADAIATIEVVATGHPSTQRGILELARAHRYGLARAALEREATASQAWFAAARGRPA